MSKAKKWEQLNAQIIACRACERLTVYREKVSEEKVRRFREHEYWGRPLPGFGDRQAAVLVLGLAPAAHGANRTGRMFTGDSSGNWLIRAMYEAGFANSDQSIDQKDGLELLDAFITAPIRCAPPGNKPLKDEFINCAGFLAAELQLLDQIKVIIALGRIAHTEIQKQLGVKGLAFGHGIQHKLDKGMTLICSYHPSRQNTQTGRLIWEDFLAVFLEARTILDKPIK